VAGIASVRDAVRRSISLRMRNTLILALVMSGALGCASNGTGDDDGDAEDGELDEQELEGRVREMLGFVGLAQFYARMPSELSGGQRRRVAFARALVARPEIMLYDEPTTGLDPITSTTITDLIVKVRDLDGVSSILVTHQLRDAFNVARTFVSRQGDDLGYHVIEDLKTVAGTEFLMLREGQVQFEGSAHDLQTSQDPYIREFLS